MLYTFYKGHTRLKERTWSAHMLCVMTKLSAWWYNLHCWWKTSNICLQLSQWWLLNVPDGHPGSYSLHTFREMSQKTHVAKFTSPKLSTSMNLKEKKQSWHIAIYMLMKQKGNNNKFVFVLCQCPTTESEKSFRAVPFGYLPSQSEVINTQTGYYNWGLKKKHKSHPAMHFG